MHHEIYTVNSIPPIPNRKPQTPIPDSLNPNLYTRQPQFLTPWARYDGLDV